MILFDIDGTLIKSIHKGTRKHSIVESIAKTFAKYNENIERNGVPFHGKTDKQIIREILAANDINVGSHAPNNSNKGTGVNLKADEYQLLLNETLHLMPELLQEYISTQETKYISLLNVNELLEKLNMRDDVICGLLTGNIYCNAYLKLMAGNINVSYFAKLEEEKMFVGAFGTDHENRNSLLPYARERYAKYLGLKDVQMIGKREMIIIGDTPKDIECGHAHKIAAVGIATGNYSVQQLKEANADAVIHDFSDLDLAIDILMNTQFTDTASSR